MDIALSWVDLGLAFVLLLSVAVGLWRGLVFEVMSLAGWVVAYFAAAPLSTVVAGWLPEGKFGPAVEHLAALVLAFVLILLIWSLVSRLIKTLVQASPLSVLDRLGGAGFGALRGCLVVLLLVLVVGATPFAESRTWRASQAAPVLTGVLHDLAPLLPEPVSHFVSRSMPHEAVSTD
jgi:membrane protein required for colicin V production